MPEPTPELSIVVPVYNEKESINKLHEKLTSDLKQVGRSYEILLIDDGSVDGTDKLLKEIAENDEKVTVISFRKNFGQTAAMAAGFEHCSGKYVVTMDADMQNDSADIGKCVETLEKGDYDVVSGWRKFRKDPFVSRKLPSMIANRIISYFTGVQLHDYGCSLKVYTKEVIDHIDLYGEMHRFIPALASRAGARIGEIPVNHKAREFGSSKYGISRTFRVILDLLTIKFQMSYMTKPLHFFGAVGSFSALLGFLISLYLVYERQFHNVGLANRPALLLGIMLIFIGMQFVSVGLLAELQVRTYHESQSKPIYTIRHIWKKDRSGNEEI